MECLPPTLTTHSFGSNAECNSRLCHAQIASRNGAMPPAGVYFDLFSLIARIAAFLIWSGVGKSGSPGPKSATSMPLAFIFSASARTAAVGEIWIRLMRSVSCTSSSFGNGQVLATSLQAGGTGANTELACSASTDFCHAGDTAGARCNSGDLRAQSLFHNRWNQPVQRAPMLSDLPHQLGTQVAIRFAGQHEHGFQTRLEFPVHQRHLQFIFIIRNSANTAQNHARPAFPRVINQQPFKHVHLDVCPLLCDLAQHLH